MKLELVRIKFKNFLNFRPTVMIVLSFFLLVCAGTLLLMLPIASRDGKSTDFIDALFTSTSASCVTGLIVKDTYQHWTTFGQIVIISLIQVGGLGIITFATFFYSLLGKKFRIRSMVLAQESISFYSFQGITKLIKNVMLVTFGTELVGAMLLSVRFVPEYGLKGFYLGIFHSIAAFCNAGFDLMSISGKGQFLSLIYYNNDPIVIYTIAGLIIMGGLGFVVWKDLFDYRKNKSLILHTKMVITITPVLIIAGAIMFFLLEYNNPATLGKLDLPGKINAAVFQSVTPRTAGFNSIDQDAMSGLSKLLTIILMFIGAAPGSTGGGVKVTTFGIVLIAILSQLKGADEIVVFKRRITFPTVIKALTIIGFSAMLVLLVTAAMVLLEGRPMINILYEVVSAFATVGLTTGMTPVLHPVSKLLLIMMMFLGRVGPVTFALALTMISHKNNTDIVHPEGKVIVG